METYIQPARRVRYVSPARRRARRRKARRRAAVCLLAVVAVCFGVYRCAAALADRLAPAQSQPPAAGLTPPQGTDEERIAWINAHAELYTEDLLDLLERHPDALDFVEGYPWHKDDEPADSVGTVEKGSFPLLLQWDERWGCTRYGGDILAINGCGPTCLAMAAAGLTGDDTITPARVAAAAEKAGYCGQNGTSWELMRTGCATWGLTSRELPLTESAVTEALTAGQPIICSVRPGDFTTTGHFILLAGLEEGGIRVNDPNSPQNSEKLWDYGTIEPQIRNLWAFSLA